MDLTGDNHESAEKKTNFEEAERQYKKAIEVEPENPTFELSLAILYHQFLSDYEKALLHYEAFKAKGGGDQRIEAWMRECRNALHSV